MITAEYYRSLLGPEEQQAYGALLTGLLQQHTAIAIGKDVPISRIVQAVHLDHPELFYVDFWHVRVHHATRHCTIVQFSMMLDKVFSGSVMNTMERCAAELSRNLSPGISVDQAYFLVARNIALSIRYRNSGSAFWDHTAAGPILGHRAVCEGIAKLFLFFCQQLELPCAIVTGTLNGVPHAWNMIEPENGIRRYLDLTGLLGSYFLFLLPPKCIFQSEEKLRRQGYVWKAGF